MYTKIMYKLYMNLYVLIFLTPLIHCILVTPKHVRCQTVKTQMKILHTTVFHQRLHYLLRHKLSSLTLRKRTISYLKMIACDPSVNKRLSQVYCINPEGSFSHHNSLIRSVRVFFTFNVIPGQPMLYAMP